MRRWGPGSYFILWLGMSHSITTFLLASSLRALGLTDIQVIFLVAVGNGLVLVPILAMSRPGARLGVSFPVVCRAVFGDRGSIPITMLRAIIAVGWFAINTWIGSEALALLASDIYPKTSTASARIVGAGLLLVVQAPLVTIDLHRLRVFQAIAAPIIVFFFISVALWLLSNGARLAPISIENTGSASHLTFAAALMGMIAFWGPMALSASDYSRWARSTWTQAIGQSLGLLVGMISTPAIALILGRLTASLYGSPTWDPLDIVSNLPSSAARMVGYLAIVSAVLSVNIPANLIPPVIDLLNVSPKRLNVVSAAAIVCLSATAFQPWRLLSSPGSFVFDWLQAAGGLLSGPLGVLVACSGQRSYLIVSTTRRHWDTATLAIAVGASVAVTVGALPSIKGAPLPLSILSVVYNFNWLAGFASAYLCTVLLLRVRERRKG